MKCKDLYIEETECINRGKYITFTQKVTLETV